MQYSIRGGVVLIDESELPKLAPFSWRFDRDGYAIRTISTKGANRRTTTEFMHRKIMCAQTGQIVDHINRIRTDNRLSNLRFCSLAESFSNRSVGNGRLITKHKNGKWQSLVKYSGISHYLGLFRSDEDAEMVSRYAYAALRSGVALPPRGGAMSKGKNWNRVAWWRIYASLLESRAQHLYDMAYAAGCRHLSNDLSKLEAYADGVYEASYPRKKKP